MTDPAAARPEVAPPLSGRAVLHDVRDIFGVLRGAGKRRIWIALLFLVFGGLTEGLSILMLLPVLQVILKGEDGATGLELGEHSIGSVPLPDVTIGLAVLLAIFVLLVVLQVAFNRAKATYLNDILFDFTNGVRLSLFSALARARWDKITRLSLSEVNHALTSEVERISTCGFLLLSIAQGLVMLIIYGIMSLWISPVMTLMMIAFGGLGIVVMRPYRRRAVQYGEHLQKARQGQFATVSDFVAGLKMARATNSEARFFDKFRHILDVTKRETTGFVRHNATGAGLFHIMITVGAAIFIYVAVQVLTMGFASLVVLLLVAMRIAPRFMALQMQAQQLLPDMAAWRQVRRLEADLNAARDDSAETSTPVPPLTRNIGFHAVSYRHHGVDAPALDDITLDIKAGQVTAIIGASGSGKSTLADLVTGLIRPQSGELRFDGRTLTPSELRGWRDQIAYVAQENVLLNMSVRDTLRSMVPGGQVDDDALWLALEQAAADEFVRAMPEGLDTVTGDRGVQISGGQRQRLALAQAFVRQPNFLVLDEATSALDWRAQEHIAATVRGMAQRNMTVLTIAHRPSMVAFADFIYALDHGRVVESGSPGDLAARAGGTYSLMLRNERMHGDTAQE